jgi:DNA polymerase III epsilon subunit-like protein
MANEKRFLVADTESCGLGNKAYVFDFGYVISNRKGKIFQERNFLVSEILTDPSIMLGALYNPDWRAMMGGKIFSHYIPAIGRQDVVLTKWRDVLQVMRDDILTYNVDVFSAYNLRFDLGAMNTTHKKLTEKKLNFQRLDLLCLWEFACITVCRSRLYHDIAREQGPDTGWITPANNVRTTAEKVYAFLSGNHGFIESHTALHDAQIETEILHRLLARKTAIPYNVLDHMPWQKAQRRKDTQLNI